MLKNENYKSQNLTNTKKSKDPKKQKQPKEFLNRQNSLNPLYGTTYGRILFGIYFSTLDQV